ncbi:RDD domain containing protein [Ferrimonas balearica DSM 9799]|uniref:RDD domain containing protein n=1 Tax=Ferrimonas balearica (strain DSM 9799 / CCM 4581 / KCTC 23876 / PAT) TaxID=550540 RepID=E1SUW8_FERBD|nr:RDD family protein [Ferrimonas balearica]MBY6016777.1 RDD family protein [Halomonas denitrificans]ADN76295.1 RDD domain containing protein [Ferrimonas balearica DSM 9799]MBW3139203.1 RDD family protein [Ferrimonas balearica]MBW3163208.1 RDD family protein [Ferrimonas balearica]MBY6094930.1 RDD family protein [Ferrimonas balearica]
MVEEELEYGGFWIRVGAALIDSVLLAMVIAPILTLLYGKEYWLDQTQIWGTWDLLLNYLLPAIAVILFWMAKSATPGKMVLKLTIVDAKTGGKPSTGQLVVRYLGYYVSTIPLLLGLFWVGIDKRKQGWHDKLAGTVVLRQHRKQAVEFEQEAP